jgi:hypothetical protein
LVVPHPSTRGANFIVTREGSVCTQHNKAPDVCTIAQETSVYLLTDPRGEVLTPDRQNGALDNSFLTSKLSFYQCSIFSTAI